MIYERECDVMHNPPHPGEILREEFLIPLNLTVTEFAKRIGVSRKVMSDILNEKAGISPAMSVKLAKALNTSAGLWANMQSGYDLWHAMQNTDVSNVQVIWKNIA